MGDPALTRKDQQYHRPIPDVSRRFDPSLFLSKALRHAGQRTPLRDFFIDGRCLRVNRCFQRATVGMFAMDIKGVATVVPANTVKLRQAKPLSFFGSELRKTATIVACARESVLMLNYCDANRLH